jgi:hypothetical protein
MGRTKISPGTKRTIDDQIVCILHTIVIGNGMAKSGCKLAHGFIYGFPYRCRLPIGQPIKNHIAGFAIYDQLKARISLSWNDRVRFQNPNPQYVFRARRPLLNRNPDWNMRFSVFPTMAAFLTYPMAPRQEISFLAPM